MDHEKKILSYIGGRNWTWIVGIVLAAAGIRILSCPDSILVLLAIVLVFMGAYYLLRALTVDLPAVRRGKKCLKQLQMHGCLEQAAAELAESGHECVGKSKTVFTPNFLFGHQNGIAYAYEDILWVYKHSFTQRVMGIPVKTVDSLMVGTAGGKTVCAVNMGRRDKTHALDAAAARIQERNPRVLLGYTPENKKAFKELTKV